MPKDKYCALLFIYKEWRKSWVNNILSEYVLFTWTQSGQANESGKVFPTGMNLKGTEKPSFGVGVRTLILCEEKVHLSFLGPDIYEQNFFPLENAPTKIS